MANGNFAGGFAKGFTSSFEIGSRARTRREEQTRRDEAMKAEQQKIGRDLAGQRVEGRNVQFKNMGVRLGSDQKLAAILESGNFEELPAGVRDMLAPHIQGQIKDVMLANPGLAPEAAQQQVMFELRNALFLPAAETRRKTQEAAAITAAQQAEQIGTASPGQSIVRGAEVVGQVPAAANVGAMINFVDPRSGEFVGTVRRDSAEATAMAQAGMIATTARIQGGREEVTGLPGTEGQRGASARRAVGAAGDITATAGVLREIESAGRGAVGLRAILGDMIGGFAGQINKDLGDVVTKGLTGVDPKTLSEIRTRAQSVAASLIQPLTGEEGRISDRELQIAQDVSRVVDDASASFEQVQGALKQAIELNLLVLDREAIQAGEKGITLETDDDINKFGERLAGQGYDRQFIIRAILALKDQRKNIGLITGE